MAKKSLADWWEEQQTARHREKARKSGAEESVEELYEKLGTQPAVDASMEAIRKEMAAVYRDMRCGRIDTNEGTRLAYVLDLLRRSHETTETKSRLGAIEKALGVKPDSPPDWLGLPFQGSEL